METTFRWRSWLGASVIVFLIFGVINVGLAIAVPATLHLIIPLRFISGIPGAGTHQLTGHSLLACAIGLATLEMGRAFSIVSGIKRAANPFGSVCEPSRSRLTSYWTWCWTGKVTRASVEKGALL